MSTSSIPTFLMSYMEEITSSMSNWHEDNYDFYRFGPLPKDKFYPAWKKLAKSFLRRRGYANTNEVSTKIFSALKLIEPYLSRFEWLYANLADDQSREVLVKVLAFRALGYRRVKLPLNTPAYWDGIKKIEQLADPTDSLATNFLDWRLFHMDLHKIDVPVNLYYTPKGVYNQFVLEQYRCHGNRIQIAVEPGDYVIDAGACWGDTALYFAYRAGESGRVFSYEFMPEHLEILRRNLALNPALSGNIQVIEKAAWSESNISLAVEADGPGSRVSKNQTRDAVTSVFTLTIDDLVKQNNLPKLDFIKMDIEGAELPALHGASQSLMRFKPKLAVSVYHNLSDFFEIPEYLNSLDLGYRFFLRHYTIHAEETVLFAEAKNND